MSVYAHTNTRTHTHTHTHTHDVNMHGHTLNTCVLVPPHECSHHLHLFPIMHTLHLYGSYVIVPTYTRVLTYTLIFMGHYVIVPTYTRVLTYTSFVWVICHCAHIHHSTKHVHVYTAPILPSTVNLLLIFVDLSDKDCVAITNISFTTWLVLSPPCRAFCCVFIVTLQGLLTLLLTHYLSFHKLCIYFYKPFFTSLSYLSRSSCI